MSGKGAWKNCGGNGGGGEGEGEGKTVEGMGGGGHVMGKVRLEG